MNKKFDGNIKKPTKRFDENVKKLIEKYEGVYSNDKNDPGGETVYGIARNYYPGWIGWDIVDAIKRYSDNLETAERKIKESERIRKLAEEFYYREYWKRLHLNQFENFPKIQEILFNIGVNKGAQRVAMFLQRALNILNKDKKYYKNLVVDGLIGRKTLNAIRKIKEIGKIRELRWWLETIVRADYLKSVEKRQKKRRYALGWAHRLKRVFG